MWGRRERTRTREIDEKEDVNLKVKKEQIGELFQRRSAHLKHTVSHTHTHKPQYIIQNNSHVKAQILLLLKEVVQDVLSDKVWV